MDEKNKLNQSIMYFIINRCSFSGATLCGGFSLEASKKRFTKSSIDRIKKLDLSYFDIYNLDFEEFINNNHDKKNLLFLRSPLLFRKKIQTYMGRMGICTKLLIIINYLLVYQRKKNWFLTYNNCDFIKKLI